MNAVAQLTEYQRQALEIAEGISRHTGEVCETNDRNNFINFDPDAFFIGAVKQGMQPLGPQVEEFKGADGCIEVQFTFHDHSIVHTRHRQCYPGEYHIV